MTVSPQEPEELLEQRRRAEQSRGLAAEHRARAHELRARGIGPDGAREIDSDAFRRAGIEEVQAEIAELRAAGFDERAHSCAILLRAEAVDPDEREDLLAQASAAVIRAAELEAHAIALSDQLAAEAA